MDAIAAIRERFEKRPHVRFEEGDGWIRYVPDADDGFPVEFRIADGGYIVSFGDWQEKFADVKPALSRFAFGLSSACRLKIVTKAGKRIKLVVEAERDGKWVTEHETGRVLHRFWRLAHVRYLQNTGL